MADEAPPPRKVGTLRDRIAQFEQKPAASAPAPPPKPAAKKTWAWKEKQAEVAVNPPTSSSAAAVSPPAVAESSESTPSAAAPDPAGDHDTTGAAAGMSAEDAKNAISQVCANLKLSLLNPPRFLILAGRNRVEA